MTTTTLWLSLLSSVLMDAVLISTNRGQLEGYTSYAAGTDSPVHVFKSVPFARAPLGELRFRLPVEPQPWNGTLNATQYSAACMSNFSRTSSPQKHISEDCLYLNIFADQRCFENRSTPCPVLTYIHGGGFTYDSAVMFNDSQIIRKYASHEIVFVIPAFRLGVFGFLDLGNDETVRRNIGIYDIIQSLKWIKEEIGNFGGNPNRITLMGNSAGASAIAFLLMSPLVPEDYFHQGISLSNTPNMIKEWNVRLSSAIVEHSGCKTSNASDQQIVDCLRNRPASDLLALQRELEVPGSLTYEGPTPDSHVLPGDYVQLLRNSKAKPMIVGLTKNEFGSRDVDNYEEVYCDWYCSIFGYHMKETRDECVRNYKNETGYYSGEYTLEAEAIHALNYRDAAVWTSKGAPVFLTSFNLENHTHHAGDLVFAMGVHYVEEMSNAEKLMDQYYPSVFRNFVNDGRPDNDWLPLDESGVGYQEIDLSSDGSNVTVPHHVNSYFYPEQVHFWLTRLSSIEDMAEESLACSSEPMAHLDRLQPPQFPLESEIANLKSDYWTILAYVHYLLLATQLIAITLLIFVIGTSLISYRRRREYILIQDHTEIVGHKDGGYGTLIL